MELGWRLALLLSLALLGAAVDRLRHGAEATRWREYSFLCGVGALGALAGALLDQVSFALSPEYFVLGKGLDPGDDLRARVTLLGAQAGLVAGLVAGGLLLVANQARPARPALPLLRLGRATPWPLAGAALLAAPGALLWPAWDPLGLERELAGLALAPARRTAFIQVHGLHVGLYLGALLGLACGVWRVIRARAAAAAARRDG